MGSRGLGLDTNPFGWLLLIECSNALTSFLIYVETLVRTKEPVSLAQDLVIIRDFDRDEEFKEEKHDQYRDENKLILLHGIFGATNCLPASGSNRRLFELIEDQDNIDDPKRAAEGYNIEEVAPSAASLLLALFHRFTHACSIIDSYGAAAALDEQATCAEHTIHEV